MQYFSFGCLFVGTLSLTAQLGLWFPGANWIVGSISFAAIAIAALPFFEEQFAQWKLQAIAFLSLWILALILAYQFPWGWE
jgi:hypothetical protein